MPIPRFPLWLFPEAAAAERNRRQLSDNEQQCEMRCVQRTGRTGIVVPLQEDEDQERRQRRQERQTKQQREKLQEEQQRKQKTQLPLTLQERLLQKSRDIENFSRQAEERRRKVQLAFEQEMDEFRRQAKIRRLQQKEEKKNRDAIAAALAEWEVIDAALTESTASAALATEALSLPSGVATTSVPLVSASAAPQAIATTKTRSRSKSKHPKALYKKIGNGWYLRNGADSAG